ncbi:MAG: ribonuclease, partial [Sphingomonadales bacterium]|nr:ribonuclease [Sphingomonadales bacterium]
RKAAAEALDAALPVPFERTAVNGFGFLQLIRRRERLSLVEIVRYRPVEAAARALMRRAERTGGHGELLLTAASQIVALIEERPDWQAELERRTGRAVRLAPDPALALWAGHVAAAQPG